MTSVTPIPGVASVVSVGGSSVLAIAANPNGGIITNPYTATDQGLSVAETLYVNPVSYASTSANGTTFALLPGQSWVIIPGQSTATYVNAASGGHKFSVVSW